MKKCALDRDNSRATAAQIFELLYSACEINKNPNAHFLFLNSIFFVPGTEVPRATKAIAFTESFR